METWRTKRSLKVSCTKCSMDKNEGCLLLSGCCAVMATKTKRPLYKVSILQFGLLFSRHAIWPESKQQHPRVGGVAGGNLSSTPLPAHWCTGLACERCQSWLQAALVDSLNSVLILPFPPHGLRGKSKTCNM